MSSILSLEPKIQEVASALWEKFDNKARNRETINMQNWADYFAYDVVSKLTLGTPIGFIQEETDVKRIISSIHMSFFQAANLGYIPGQMAWVRNPLVSYILHALHGANEYPPWAAKILMARRETPKRSAEDKDLLDHFISMKEPDGSPATDLSVQVELGNIIAAGADVSREMSSPAQRLCGL